MAPLLTIQSATKIYGVKPLFEEISLVIADNERIALIGPNGAGKSTLLRSMLGEEHLDSGAVSLRKGLRIGYVPQHDPLPSEGSVEDVLGAAVNPQHDRAAQVAVYMGKGGFHDRRQPVAALSGGWRKRLAILCALIKEPDLLLLDEPTNHLDIESIIWLEEILSSAAFAVLFISHDRYFIENCAQRVVELDRRYPKGYLAVSGNYSDFISTRAAFLDQLQSYRDSLANRVRFEAEWLRQGAKARTTKAKGRINEAHRLMEELAGIDLRKRQARIEFSASGRRSKELLKAEKISKAFGEKLLFRDLSLTVSPGMRLGIAGSNGSGKTTLLRTLLKEIAPDQGRVWQAPQLRAAFFDQSRQGLNPDEPLLKALCNAGDAVVFNGQQLHVSTWAGRFLFSSEQLNLPVRELSGGEQARLLIARLLLQPADLLVFDEPTNDLDTATLEVIEAALCEFSGAVLLVTHDRYLLDRVSTLVVGLPGDGRAEVFANYTQWEICKDDVLSQRAAVSPKKGAPKDDRKHLELPVAARPKKLTYAERLELEAIEERVVQAEAHFEQIKLRIADPEVTADPQKLRTACEELTRREQEVEAVYARWHELEQKKAGASK